MMTDKKLGRYMHTNIHAYIHRHIYMHTSVHRYMDRQIHKIPPVSEIL